MEALLGALAPSIHRFASRLCRNDADSADVLQEALFSVATNLDRFEGRSSLPSWAFSLTRSACTRRRRGRKNRPAEGVEALESHVDEAPTPEEQALRAELVEGVESALDGLPEEYREVLLLRDVEGLTAPEAALALGVSVEALKSRLHRARAALREALRPVIEAETAGRAAGCPDVVGALSRKLEGDLGEETCKEMEKHVASCDSCARACDAMRDVLRACRASADATLTPELQAQVRAAISRLVRGVRGPRRG
jgi:RNA polymerase sigma-70 factor, ECF subfamily